MPSQARSKVTLEAELAKVGKALSETAYCIGVLSTQLNAEREKQTALWDRWHALQHRIDRLDAVLRGEVPRSGGGEV